MVLNLLEQSQRRSKIMVDMKDVQQAAFLVICLHYHSISNIFIATLLALTHNNAKDEDSITCSSTFLPLIY